MVARQPAWAKAAPAQAAIARRRLLITGLEPESVTTPRFSSAEQIVRWFGAYQGQEYGPAKWGLGQRLGPDATEAQVEAEFDTGRLVRTHVLRPTWHFVAVDELPWLLELTGARVSRTIAYYDRQAGLTQDLLELAHPIVEAALAGGKALTRKELQSCLAECRIEAAGLLMSHILMHAELDGLICSGPRAGKQHSYQLLAERLEATGLTAYVPSSREEALARLAVTYFRSHGPATSQDFRWWSGLLAADLKTGLAAAGDQVHAETIDGVTYWSTDDGPSDVSTTEPDLVRLIQAFDEYTVAFTQSKAAFQLALTARNVTWQPRPTLSNTLLVGTQLAGHWRPTIRGSTLEITVQTYRTVTRALADGIATEAARQARFLGLESSTSSVQEMRVAP